MREISLTLNHLSPSTFSPTGFQLCLGVIIRCRMTPPHCAIVLDLSRRHFSQTTCSLARSTVHFYDMPYTQPWFVCMYICTVNNRTQERFAKSNGSDYEYLTAHEFWGRIHTNYASVHISTGTEAFSAAVMSFHGELSCCCCDVLFRLTPFQQAPRLFI